MPVHPLAHWDPSDHDGITVWTCGGCGYTLQHAETTGSAVDRLTMHGKVIWAALDHARECTGLALLTGLTPM